MPTDVATSKTFVHSDPNLDANAQQKVASGANNSWQNADAEPGASDGWFMGQDSLSSEEESDMKKGTQILMQMARFKSSGDQHFHHPEMQPGAENRAVVTAGQKITG